MTVGSLRNLLHQQGNLVGRQDEEILVDYDNGERLEIIKISIDEDGAVIIETRSLCMWHCV